MWIIVDNSVKLTCFCLQIDLQTFLTLTDQDLKELGITTFGARRKMLLAISGTAHELIAFHFSCYSSSLLSPAHNKGRTDKNITIKTQGTVNVQQYPHTSTSVSR